MAKTPAERAADDRANAANKNSVPDGRFDRPDMAKAGAADDLARLDRQTADRGARLNPNVSEQYAIADSVAAVKARSDEGTRTPNMNRPLGEDPIYPIAAGGPDAPLYAGLYDPNAPFDPGRLDDPRALAAAAGNLRDDQAAREAEDKIARTKVKRFDVMSVEQQIDVIREYVRRLWGHVGPVPAILMADHDMAWESREELRLKQRDENDKDKIKNAADKAAADRAAAGRSQADAGRIRDGAQYPQNRFNPGDPNKLGTRYSPGDLSTLLPDAVSRANQAETDRKRAGGYVGDYSASDPKGPLYSAVDGTTTPFDDPRRVAARTDEERRLGIPNAAGPRYSPDELAAMSPDDRRRAEEAEAARKAGL